LSDWQSKIVGWDLVAPDQLLAHPGNFRRHPLAQREALRGSLNELGIIAPVLVNRTTGHLLDGHARVEEYLSAGVAGVPVAYVEIPADKEGLALLSLDPIAAMAEADKDALEALLREAHTEDAGLQALLAQLAKDTGLCSDQPVPEDPGAQLDKADELREKWGTELGQLWEIPSETALGHSHRLLCGDSTDPAVVARLMNGERAALFATDPPYLVDYDGTNHPHKWNGHDANKDWSESYHDWDQAAQGDGLYDGFVSVAVETAIRENAAWYCWHASRRQAMLEEVWERHSAFVHQQIIWVKDRPILTRSWYMWQHEPCFFGWVRGRKPMRRADDHPASVWVLPTVGPGQATDHPTSKPVEVFAIPMRQHTNPGEICYEPFSGSGSQHVAGEQTGRLVYGLELQPVYVAVILERLSGMGLEPRLLEESE
jgi:DNA modification methylase